MTLGFAVVTVLQSKPAVGFSKFHSGVRFARLLEKGPMYCKPGDSCSE